MMIHRLSYLFLVVFLAVSTLANAQDQGLPEATSAQVVGDQSATRIFIDFTGPLATKALYNNQPNRIIIDLDEVRFSDAVKQKLLSAGLIKSAQAGRIKEGKPRLVLELAGPAKIVRGSLKQVLDGDLHRYQLDLEAILQQEFDELVESQTVDLESATNSKLSAKSLIKDLQASENKEKQMFTLVIDPGHGGIDSGAVGKQGTREKVIVLEFAKILAEKLRRIGSFRVLMTRTGDEFISLRKRLDFNRQSKADLFISVHADSLSQQQVRGATVYFLSKKASDKISAELAESENRVDLLAGLSLDTPNSAVADILVDLTTRETKHYSKQFSKILVSNLGKEIELIQTNPIRSAAFAVLKAPDVPSVLLELGYLSNPEDEKLMRTQLWQHLAAKAVVKSVEQFFQARL